MTDPKMLPVIPTSVGCRAIDVSKVKFDCALAELENEGAIRRQKTPTGREHISPEVYELVVYRICG